MTEAAMGGADAYALRKLRRRSARRFMQSLTLVCVLASAGLAADQFYSGGLQAFLDRPAGVGATPPQVADTAIAQRSVAPPSSPQRRPTTLDAPSQPPGRR